MDGWVDEDWSQEVLSALRMTQGTKVWIDLVLVVTNPAPSHLVPDEDSGSVWTTAFTTSPLPPVHWGETQMAARTTAMDSRGAP